MSSNGITTEQIIHLVLASSCDSAEEIERKSKFIFTHYKREEIAKQIDQILNSLIGLCRD